MSVVTKLRVTQIAKGEGGAYVNAKDLPGVIKGTMLEVAPSDAGSSSAKLVVKLLGFREEQRNNIWIDQTAMNVIQLRQYTDVNVCAVKHLDVALDSVELVFKDQYLTRSDMWRLAQSMVDTGVYLKKEIKYNSTRCDVFEMWAKGVRLSSGLVTKDTKVVFRTASGMVVIFIQMSAEMWQFDIHGDLYFEKALDGFLLDLTRKWKDFSCNHDVTIVLFSRTFYNADSWDQFPEQVRHCIQQDVRGRFYEDVYRVAVQNERLDDWTATLRHLKIYFSDYQRAVVHKHSNVPGMPTAYNSCAALGNFLPALNLSMNVFEKHFTERSFDRTGQLSVVVTPGVGVFEVERDLMELTKQRIIDNGIASDLVCLGEQPLHVVPLYKVYGSLSDTGESGGDEYSIPHWINLSFYTSSKVISYSAFVPRIKLPTPDGSPSPNIRGSSSGRPTGPPTARSNKRLMTPTYDGVDEALLHPNDSHTTGHSDYEGYDMHILKEPVVLAQRRAREKQEQAPVRRKSQVQYPREREREASLSSASSPSAGASAINTAGRHISEPLGGPSFTSHYPTYSTGITGSPRGADTLDSISSTNRMVVGSVDSSVEYLKGLQRPQKSAGQELDKLKALVNPFNLSGVSMKLTSNRRRWTHAFPIGPSGSFVQQHHYQSNLTSKALTEATRTNVRPIPLVGGGVDVVDSGPGGLDRTGLAGWGPTGEQQWTPALTTGVDWKSLVIPACLPLTTDYFPDPHTLVADYTLSDYCLLPEDIPHASAASNLNRDVQVYQELVCQRLQQGFQIVTLPPNHPYKNSRAPLSSFPDQRGRKDGGGDKLEPDECLMSIAAIFHSVQLGSANEIAVKQYKPRQASQELNSIPYRYQFTSPGNEGYTHLAKCIFHAERLETFNWNYLDHYICGEREYFLHKTNKFWRFRMLLLPGSPDAIRSIQENGLVNIYPIDGHGVFPDERSQREGVLKFFEILNKIKPISSQVANFKSHLTPSSKSNIRRSSFGQHSPVSHGHQQSLGAVRERCESVNEKPRKPRATLQHDDSEKSTSSTSLEDNATVSAGGAASDDAFLVNPPPVLSMINSSEEIVAAMRQSMDFIPKDKERAVNFPSHAFLGVDAISWLRSQISDMHEDDEAIAIMQRLMRDGFVAHIRGEQDFVVGSHLYFLREIGEPDEYSDLAEEWVEVGIISQSQKEVAKQLPASQQAQMKVSPSANNSRLYFKRAYVNIDAGRSDRPEWGQAQYHSVFQPGTAFELDVEWVVATGNIVADMVLNWARKATSFGLQLVPIPCEPYALPGSANSDPLRGPIFVPLAVDQLPDPLTYSQLQSFKGYILRCFGFIPHQDLYIGAEKEAGKLVSSYETFVHCTGGMFLVPSEDNAEEPYDTGLREPLGKTKFSPEPESQSEELPKILNNSATTGNQSTNECQSRTGFLWSYNFMITKRWKSTASIDEHFMRTVLEDIRKFCSNSDDRLLTLYEDWSKLNAPKPQELEVPPSRVEVEDDK
ncbi:GATOR complex protein DEPDC5-like isoform X2 [Varroa jacobsoni]|uniref:GATOR complex protein DEPDC5-like isoform X2 n=1 Tax=Varroa jacobsoni TaxID=62625 RepID=UPI000BF2C68F|nr:GATOR complex protein DEPDC5-like isoform X2 [Varroa jacobsoni]